MHVTEVDVHILSDGYSCCKVTVTQSSIINRMLFNLYKDQI